MKSLSSVRGLATPLNNLYNDLSKIHFIVESGLRYVIIVMGLS
jgi:hypothetical protein